MIKRKNITLYILFLIILLGTSITGMDLNSININFIGSKAIVPNSSITNISGVGFEVYAEGKIGGGFYLNLRSSHLYLNIDQNNTLEHWNWEYWDQIYGNTIASVRQQERYECEIEPAQKLFLKPYTLEIGYSLDVGNKFNISTNLGFGIAWYKRQLWLNEHWDKYFETLDYTYEYNFRNIARPKRDGFVYVGNVKIGASYNLSKFLAVYTEVGGYYFPKIRDDSQYLPLDNSVDVSVGIGILY